jgi:AAA+ superfamily predicted ATPase
MADMWILHKKLSVGVYFPVTSLKMIFLNLQDLSTPTTAVTANSFSSFVIQSKISYFAYEPVLKCLKRKLSVTVLSSFDSHFLVQSDLYFKDEILSNAPKPVESTFLPIPSLVREKLSSDPSQLKAVEYALSRRLAIIQGPPGTGKTFVGVQLVSTLLRQDPNAKILCICYTNHALDSFLESLLDEGLPKQSIVRFGSMSKVSARMQDTCFQNLKDGTFDRGQNRRYAILRQQEKEEKGIKEDLLRILSTPTFTAASWEAIQDFFENSGEYFHLLEQFKVPGGLLTSDVQTVGRNNRKLREDSFYQDWCRGQAQPSQLDLSDVPREQNYWLKSLDERKSLLQKWRKEWTVEDIEILISRMDRYDRYREDLSNLREENKIETLSSGRIIACTTTFAAKNRNLIDSCCPNIILVEEAAEIHESHILTNLTSNIKRLIMIGDHKQLRPKMEYYPLRVDSGRNINFDISLFERLVNSGYQPAQLQIQHRMRPTISYLIKDTYPDLLDHEKVKNRDNIKGVDKNILFIHHTSLENTESDAFLTDLNSKSNEFEAKMIIRFIVYLLQQGYNADDIVVLTPYLGQLMKIRTLMRNSRELNAELSERDEDEIMDSDDDSENHQTRVKRNIRVATIDNFQGEEAKIILASLVRSNNNHDIGFVSGPERINVLCSRARDGFYLFGNKETFKNARNNQGRELWKSLIQKLEENSCVVSGVPIVCQNHDTKQLVKKPEDFDTFSPFGGCNNVCGELLPSCASEVKHKCPGQCHPLTSHSKQLCEVEVISFCHKRHQIKRRCCESNFVVCQQKTSSLCSTGKHQIPHRCDEDPPSCKKCAKLKEQADKKLLEIEVNKKAMEDDIFELEQQQNELNIDLLIEQEKDKMKVKEELLKQDIAESTKKLQSARNKRSTINTSTMSSPPASTSGPTQSSGNTAYSPGDLSAPTPVAHHRASSRDRPVGDDEGGEKKGENDHPVNMSANSSHVQNSETVNSDRTNDLINRSSTNSTNDSSSSSGNSGNDDSGGIDGSISVISGNSDRNSGANGDSNPVTGNVNSGRNAANVSQANTDFPQGNEDSNGTGITVSSETTSSSNPYSVLVSASFDDLQKIIKIIEEEKWLEALDLIKARKSSFKIDDSFSESSDVDWMLIFILIHCNLYEDNDMLLLRVNDVKILLDQDLLSLYDENTLLLYDYTAMMTFSIDSNLRNLALKYAKSFLERFTKVSQPPSSISPVTNFYIPKTWKLKADEILKSLEQGSTDRTEREPTIKDQWVSLRQRNPEYKSSASMESLLGMIGLNSVKKSFYNLYQKVMMSKYEQKVPLDGFNFNSLFIGNPGTGKTTVAQLFANFLTEIEFFNFEAEILMKTGSELITMGVDGLEAELKAMGANGGGVVFIDEAYQLNDREGRAIKDCILGNSEKMKGKYGNLVWILAGYKKQMEDFLKENPGLPSRFPESFVFEDYSDEDLELILKGWFDRGGRDVFMKKTSKSEDKKKTTVDNKPRPTARRNPMYGRLLPAAGIDQWGNSWTADNLLNSYYDDFDNTSGYGPNNMYGYPLGDIDNPIVSNSTGIHWCYDQSSKKWYNKFNPQQNSKTYPGKPVEVDENEESRKNLQPIKPFLCSNPKWVRIAARRIGRGRGVEGFGNARAVRTLFQKSHTRQIERIDQLRLQGYKPNVFMFERNDLLGPKASLVNLQSSKAWKKLQDLEGLKDVKESMGLLLETVISNADREEEEKHLLELVLNRVFLGNPGTGKTTVAGLYGEILGDLGMLSKGETKLTTASDYVGPFLGTSEELTKGILEQSKGCVLVIDEAYGLYTPLNSAGGKGQNEPYREAVINTLVEQVQGKPGEDRAVILIGYREEMEEMFKNTNPGFSRRFQLESAFEFKDYDDEALMRILKKTVEKEDLQITTETAAFAVKQLARARAKPHFGNAGAVNNLLSGSKLKMQKRIKEARTKGDSTINPDLLEKDDFKAKDYQEEPLKPRDLLKELVGCDEIRKKLDLLCKKVDYNKTKGKDIKSVTPYNYLFVGNPGTGKTTVARLMGKMFHSLGLIPDSECVEVTPSSFLTGYVGQAANKTKEFFKTCKGKVLFIDEAYQLNPKNGGSFMKEVLDEIVGLITSEDYRNQIIIILAGYDKDIQDMLSANQGLQSRFSETYHFNDLTTQEIVEMIPKKLEKEDEKNWNSDAYKNLNDIADKLKKLPNFSNGRDIETFIKKVIDKKIDRFEDDNRDEIIAEDLTEALNEMKKNRKPVSTNTNNATSNPFSSNFAFNSAMPPPPPSINVNTSTSDADKEEKEKEEKEKEADEEHDSVLPEAFQENEWDDLSSFIPKLQDILEEKGWNNEEAIDILSDSSNSHPYKNQLIEILSEKLNLSIPSAASLFKKWQKKQSKIKDIRQALKDKKEAAAKKGKKSIQVPIWRCAVCGRADQPNIVCYVAPFIVRYEERPL